MTTRTTIGPVRVLYCIDHLASGGAEQLLVRYLDHLHGGPVDAAVVTMQTRDGNPVRADVEALGVPVTDLGIGRLRDADAGAKVRAAVADAAPDVVHTQLEFSNVLATRAASRAGIPSLATLHTLDTPSSLSRDGLRYRLMMRTLRRDADLVVAVSESARRHHLRHGRLDAARVTTIHNGIDPGPFAEGVGARVRLRHGIPGDAPVLVTVAVHREPKGIQFMLDALPVLLARRPDTVYLLVGDGPHRRALEERANALGVADAVRFAGARRDVPDHLAAADAFVLPSLTEALPTVIAEAMAASLPVVATTVGGTPEMVVDGETGILVPPSDPGALADAVGRLFDDGALRARLGAAGRARARTAFSIDSQAEALLAEYRRLAGVGSAP
ncbi:MAG: glycosyltransferase family 4 protein [Acidimicrobiia bacterium]|nr:glycosyltransferase family 4 protein [Acidimicrobiia bacterium]